MRIRSTIGAALAVTALGVAGAVALPTVSSDQILNATDQTEQADPAPVDTDDPVAVALSLAEALQRDLGMTPEEFVSQANTAAELGDKASEWSEAFQDAFGGVWLNDFGEGVVGVATVLPEGNGEKKADPKVASELRAAAEDAGFVVQDVALSKSELEARLKEVQDVIEGLPQDQRDLITGVQADQNRGAVVVTTDGGTEAELGNLTAALHGLAKLQTVNAPDPSNDTSPFGSLEDSKQGQGSGDENADPSNGTVDGLGTGATPAEQTTTEQATPDATTEQAPETTTETEAPAEGDEQGTTSSLSSFLSPEALGVLTQILGMAGGEESLGSLGSAGGSLADFVPLPDPEPTPPTEDAPSDPNAEAAEQAKAPASGDDVIGGTAYDAKMPIGELECSTGFNGTLNGAPVVITAAHCNRVDGVRAAFADGTEFGTFSETKPDHIDSAIIKVDEGLGDRFDNNLVGGEEGKAQEITGTAAPVAGQVACKMGSRTGFSCGKIAETGTQIDVAGQRTIDNAFTIDICALPGDSGGVVFSGNKALGISSASNVAGEKDCNSAQTNADAAGVTPSLSVVPIDDVLAAHPGLELNTK